MTAAFAVVAAASVYVLFGPAGPQGGTFPGADKIVHLALFAALAATARVRFGGTRLVAGLLVAYAVGSEVVQAAALPDRSGDPLDVLADLVGAGLGWALAGRWAGVRAVSARR